MNPDSESPVVMITGASGGLGRALAAAFSTDGWRVAAAGHSRVPEFTGPAFDVSRVDVTDRRTVRSWVSDVLGRWGRIDVLLNNAGVTRDGPLPGLDAAAWDLVLDVNLKGPFLCAQAALPTMLRQEFGQVLNVASYAGKSGARGQANYAAAKAGLIGFTLSLAREVGRFGVCANVVLPGVLPTSMTGTLSEGVMGAFAAANELGRINDLNTVAKAIVSIARMRDVSGQVFQLDSRVGRWT